jgi:hypothetical protein
MSIIKCLVVVSGALMGWGLWATAAEEAPPPHPASVAPGDELKALREAKVAAARTTYEKTFKALRQPVRVENVLVQVSKPEDAYHWSVRWFEAQKELCPTRSERVTAAEAHLERMVELKKRVEVLTACLLPGFENDAAEFYRVEAEIWLKQEKNK